MNNKLRFNGKVVSALILFLLLFSSFPSPVFAAGNATSNIQLSLDSTIENISVTTGRWVSA